MSPWAAVIVSITKFTRTCCPHLLLHTVADVGVQRCISIGLYHRQHHQRAHFHPSQLPLQTDNVSKETYPVDHIIISITGVAHT